MNHGLIVSSDFQIDFNNGIIFNFGQYGSEIKVFENGKEIMVSELPQEILNLIRSEFNRVYNYDEQDENLIQNQVKID